MSFLPSPEVHFYVFFYRPGNKIPFYDRTMPCERTANSRVKKLEERENVASAFWATKPPEDFYY